MDTIKDLFSWAHLLWVLSAVIIALVMWRFFFISSDEKDKGKYEEIDIQNWWNQDDS